MDGHTTFNMAVKVLSECTVDAVARAGLTLDDIDLFVYHQANSRILKAVINGWSVSPILKLRSGRPFTVTNGGQDSNLDGSTNDRAQLVGDPFLDNPTPDMWFNIFAFARNPVITGQAIEGVAYAVMQRGQSPGCFTPPAHLPAAGTSTIRWSCRSAHRRPH